MFGKSKQMENLDVTDYKVFILYSDKLTKKNGRSLVELISSNYKEAKINAALIDSKFLRDNEARIGSNTNIIALGNQFADEFVASPLIKDTYFNYGIHIRISGCHCTIYTDDISKKDFESMLKELKDESNGFKKESVIMQIAQYAGVAVLLGLIGVGALSLYKFFRNKKTKTDFQYVYAINKLHNDYLRPFLSND
jgi:hypothetical protein